MQCSEQTFQGNFRVTVFFVSFCFSVGCFGDLTIRLGSIAAAPGVRALDP